MAYDHNVNRKAPRPHRAHALPNELRARFVYVIARGPETVKVGVSKNVERRASGIRSATPDLVTIAHRAKPIAGTAFDAETEAHRLLAPWRISGEWFGCEIPVAIIAVDAACTRNQDKLDFVSFWSTAYKGAHDGWAASIKRLERVPRRGAHDEHRFAMEAHSMAFDALDKVRLEALRRWPDETYAIEGQKFGFRLWAGGTPGVPWEFDKNRGLPAPTKRRHRVIQQTN